MSKLLVNNLVRLYGKKAASEAKNVLINSACPGFCDTDMTAGIPCEKVMPKNLKFLHLMQFYSRKLLEMALKQSFLSASSLQEDLNQTER